MSVASLQKQQAIDSALKKVDGDIRKFTASMEKAKISTDAVSKQECLDELQSLIDKLRQQRHQVRTWSTESGAQKAKKHKLADARQRIEHEMKRFDEFMASVDASTSRERVESHSTSVASSGQDTQEVKVTVDQILSDGVNDELVSEFTCKICMMHVVGCGPMLTKCSHLFCGDCISQWFTMQPSDKTWAQRAKAGGSVPCPVCREPLLKDQDLHEVRRDGDGGNKFLHNMLSSTRIMCGNNPKCSPSGNCDWVGDYGSYQEHIRLCENLPIYGRPTPAPEPAVTHALVLEPISTDAEPSNDEVEHPCSGPSAEPVSVESAVEEQWEAECAADVSLVDADPVEALMEIRPKEYAQPPTIEIDDMCSTHASEQLGSLEPSEANLSDHLASPAASEGALSDHEEDALAQANLRLAEQAAQEAAQRQRQATQLQVALEAALTQQRAAMQLQAAMQWRAQQQVAAQYQAQYQAHYQAQYAAHYQSAQDQYQAQVAAHYQSAQYQAEMAKWTQAARMAQHEANRSSVKATQSPSRKSRGKK